MTDFSDPRRLIPLSILLFFVTFFASCNKDEMAEPVTSSQDARTTLIVSNIKHLPKENCNGVPTANQLFTDGHIFVGEINISNSDDSIYVTFLTKYGWAMKHTAISIGKLEDIQYQHRNSQSIESFEFSNSHNLLVTSWTYSFPIEDYDECFCVVAKAEAYLLNASNQVLKQSVLQNDGQELSTNYSLKYLEYCTQLTQISEVKILEFPVVNSRGVKRGVLRVTNNQDSLILEFEVIERYVISQIGLFVGDSQQWLHGQNSLPPLPISIKFSNKISNKYRYIVSLSKYDDCFSIISSIVMVNSSYNGYSEQLWVQAFPTQANGYNNCVVPYCIQDVE